MTEACAGQVLSLPCFPELTEGEVAEVARVVLRIDPDCLPGHSPGKRRLTGM